MLFSKMMDDTAAHLWNAGMALISGQVTLVLIASGPKNLQCGFLIWGLLGQGADKV